MSGIVTVRGLDIGRGLPKIIVPIVEPTAEAIAARAASFAGKPVDLIEWRADFYEHALEPDLVVTTLAQLRQAAGNLPILFTLRTTREGGKAAVSPEAYTALNTAVARSGLADLIDVEILSGDEVVRQNIDSIHAAGSKVIGSNHDFSATPPREVLVSRLVKMVEMGADIAKIAVMPRSRLDVLTLLAATAEMKDRYPDHPLITIAMSQLGVVTRITGELFGSAATFGSVDKTSAPGQIPVEQLAALLKSMHELV